MAFVVETARVIRGAMSRFEARGKLSLALSPPVPGIRFWPRRPLDLMKRLQKFGRRA
jgi:hypothetical protein